MPISDITTGSVHSPAAMGSLSIRGRGKKWKNLSISKVNEFARNKGITFVEAYRVLTSKIYKGEED